MIVDNDSSLLISMKNSIYKNLPNDKKELSWIIDTTGNILFKEKWIKIKPLQIIECTVSKIGQGFILTINNCFKEKGEVEDLINYLFSTSMHKLLN